MNIENWSFLVRFLITTGIFLVYLVFLVRKQLEEVTQPYDAYTQLRWMILAILLITILTLAPLMMYQIFVAMGHEYRVLRNVVSIVGGINQIASTVLLVLIFKYKVRR